MMKSALYIFTLCVCLLPAVAQLSAQDFPPGGPGPDPVEIQPPPDMPFPSDDPDSPSNGNACCEWEEVNGHQHCRILSRGRPCP